MTCIHINFWALLVSALMQWVLGALWYSPPLFSKPWMALAGCDCTKMKKSAPYGMIASFIGSLVLSFVLVHIIRWAGVSSFGCGAAIGFLCWLGFLAAPLAAASIYEGRPFKLFAINHGYWLLCLLLSGGLLAVWR